MRSSSITCQTIILQKLFPKQRFTSRYIVYWANFHHISLNGLMLVILTLWSCWVEMGIWKDRCKNNPPARRKSSGVVSHIRPNFSHLSKPISKDSVYKHKHTHTKWYLSECLTGRVASNNAVIETSCCSCSPLIVNNKRKTSRKRWVKIIFWREVPKRKCLFLQPACCHQEWIIGIISPLTSMILLQAAVQFSGCPYTVIAFSSAAECSSFLRLVSIKSWSGSVAAVFGHYLMAVVVTKLQGFYLCTSTLARDCCVIALDYKLGKAKKSL